MHFAASSGSLRTSRTWHWQGASHEAFLEAAKLVEDVPFYRTTDLSVAKKVGITKPGFVLTRNYPGAYGESAFLKDVRPRLSRKLPTPCQTVLSDGKDTLPAGIAA